jgi:hypothetical protein
MPSGRIACLTVTAMLVCAASAVAQDPPPVSSDLPSPGAVAVDGEIVVTRQETARVKLHCIQGEVACTGSVRVSTTVPVSPGKGKARRVVTVVDGSVGELAPGEYRTVELPLKREALRRVRAYRSTPVEWHTYRLDGTEHFLFLVHRTKLMSRVAK